MRFNWSWLLLNGGRCAALALAVAVSAGTGGQASGAETPPGTAALTIEVPLAIEIEQAADTPLPIRVSPEAAVPRQAMVLIRGLSPSMTLNNGRLFDSGVWAVRAADLPGLRITAPGTTSEKLRLSVSVVALDGAVLATAESNLGVIPASPGSRSQRQAVANRGKPQLTLEDVENAQIYMKKGEENLRAGNVVVARLFYNRAATAGWAAGALALGSTYDSAELTRLNIAGDLQPDPVLARKWYEKALDMGAVEARERLQRLSGR